MLKGRISKLCGALVASAFAFGTAAHGADLKMTFAMPTTPAPYLLPFFLAKDLGWLGKAGLTVEEKVVTGDTNCMRAVLTGDADTTLIGPNTIMQAVVSGAPLKLIGSFQPVVDYQIVARKGSGTSIKDLGDKKWAIASVGGMTQALPRMVLKKHGVDGSNTQYLSVGGLSSRYQAIAAGTVDASLLDVQLALRGEKEGRAKIISAVHDDLPNMGYVFFPMRTSALADPKQREAMHIFIREGIRGVRYIIDRPEDAAKVLAKRMKVDDVASLTETLKKINTLGVWGVNGGINKEVLDFSQKVYRDSGDVTQDVPYDKLVDASLVEASLKELGKR
jgi:NitT/TauT family transport system substrate-binding protein